MYFTMLSTSDALCPSETISFFVSRDYRFYSFSPFHGLSIGKGGEQILMGLMMQMPIILLPASFPAYRLPVIKTTCSPKLSEHIVSILPLQA